MPIELISLPPVLVALWLLAFGDEAAFPSRERVGMVLGASVVLGPLALAVLGVFGWLLLLALVIVSLTVYAFLRRSVVGRYLPRLESFRLPKIRRSVQ